MSITARIRIELLLGGPMTLAQLTKRCDRKCSDLHPYLHQLQRRKKDPVIKVRNRYALKRLQCALADQWK